MQALTAKKLLRTFGVSTLAVLGVPHLSYGCETRAGYVAGQACPLEPMDGDILAFYTFLVPSQHVLTNPQIAAMTNEQIRNTEIEILHDKTGIDIRTLQSKSNKDLASIQSDWMESNLPFWRNGVIEALQRDGIDVPKLQSMSNQDLHKLIAADSSTRKIYSFVLRHPSVGELGAARLSLARDAQFSQPTNDQIRDKVVDTLHNLANIDIRILQSMSNKQLDQLCDGWDDPLVTRKMDSTIDPGLIVVGEEPPFEKLAQAIKERCINDNNCNTTPYTFESFVYSGGHFGEGNKTICTIQFPETQLGGDPKLSKGLQEAFKQLAQNSQKEASRVEEYSEARQVCDKGTVVRYCSPVGAGPLKPVINWGIPPSIIVNLRNKEAKAGGLVGYLRYTISCQSAPSGGCLGGSKSFADFLKVGANVVSAFGDGAGPEAKAAGNAANILGGLITFACDAVGGN
jgi:hypothetical protein